MQHQTHIQPTSSNTPRRIDMNTIELQPIDEFSISTVPVARCADGNGTLTPLFFSDHVLDIARAKAICAKCALAESCLSDALEREEPWGVWGGELLSGGRIVAHKRPGGRPPKRPRPPVIVNELGVVDTDGDELEPLAV
jgi:WhiB family redox-sensing transcriptional regulator